MADIINSDRLKIIEFSKNKFLKEGFYKISMDSLASEMQISKKTIYKYFPSKENLVQEVTNLFISDISAKTDENINRNADAITKIAGQLNILSEGILTLSDKWLNDIRLHAPSLWNQIDAFRIKKMNMIFSKLIEQGKKEGIFEDKPTDIFLTVLVASVRAIVNPDFLYYSRLSFTQSLETIFDILFNGMLTKQGKTLFAKSIKKRVRQ